MIALTLRTNEIGYCLGLDSISKVQIRSYVNLLKKSSLTATLQLVKEKGYNVIMLRNF